MDDINLIKEANTEELFTYFSEGSSILEEHPEVKAVAEESAFVPELESLVINRMETLVVKSN